jgi:LemA protein
MPGQLIIGIVLIGFALVVLFWVISTYNALVRRRIAAENGWAQIDVQLKRRYDLIPNLVETVKGYASHEREALEAVIAARSRAVNVPSDAAHAGEKGVAEGFLTQALGRLFALSEAYPDLKANVNFLKLQEELSSTENRIGFARQHFNDSVAGYEKSRQTFPANMIAGAFNFKKLEYFTIEDGAQREVPKVSFS